VTRPLLVMFLVLTLIAGGLALYAKHLRNRVAQEEQRLAAQPKVVLPPASGPTTAIRLYLADDAEGTVHAVQDSLALPEERSERARAILRELLGKYLQSTSPHAVGAGSDVLDVFLLGPDTAIVNASAGFADSHPSGILAEELTIASLVLTLNANDPRIARVKILVDGKERETLAGHADLSRFYTASDLEVLVRTVK
jgi:hypothetical protein